MTRILQTIPLLRIFDVAKTREFYADYLGFQIEWEHRFADDAPLYMQATRDGCVLHLTEHHGDCTPGSAVFIWMEGLDAFYAEIGARNYRFMRPGIETAFYKARCVTVIDPFGNRLIFNERLVEQLQ